MGSGATLHAKSYMRKGFLIYEEMRKYLVIFGEAVSHIWLCTRSFLYFLIYEENFILFFISVAGGRIKVYDLLYLRHQQSSLFWFGRMVTLFKGRYL
jgi:hypothetical protein